MKIKMGANKEGKITAADATLIYEAGAYPGSPVNPGCQCIFGPYNIQNGRIEGYDVLLNKPKTAAYRAPGAPGAAFAAETVIDEICEKLGIDPLEFRLINGAKEGTRRITGPRFPRIGYLEPWKPLKTTNTTVHLWRASTGDAALPAASGSTVAGLPVPRPASTPTAQ